MNIETKYHGQQQIDPQFILHFDKGLPGFPKENQFVLLPLAESAFFILQSVTTAQIGFVIGDPFSFFPDYDFKLDESTVEQLGIIQGEDVIVYTILTVEDPFERTTANLLAPVIINKKNNKGKQVILNNENYKTRHPIMKQKVKE